MASAAPIRTTTLGGYVIDEGIRIYSKNTNGDCREACNSLTTGAISAACVERDKRVVETGDGWFAGEFKLSAHPASAICAFGWRAWPWDAVVWYQSITGEIRGRRHEQRGWVDCEYSVSDALKGTDMALIGHGPTKNHLLFYQDSEGYLCYWQAFTSVRSRRQPEGRIAKACRGTGIAAVGYNQLNNIHVYYQDEDYVLREVISTGNKPYKWIPVSVIDGAPSRPLGSMAAVCWSQSTEVQIRLYFQNGSDDIVERCRGTSTTHWIVGAFRQSALPGSDVLAYTRPLDGRPATADPLLGVLWSGSDQVLHQRVDPPTWGWLSDVPIAYLRKAGAFAGSWNNTRFRDSDAGCAAKVIQKVIVHAGGFLDGYQLVFTDGSSTPWRGGRGGTKQEFILVDGEDITQIMIWHDHRIVQRIKFITSKGRESPSFGYSGEIPYVWDSDGQPLAGFSGASGSYINGLIALWGDRQTGVGSGAAKELIKETQTMRREIADSQRRCAALQEETDVLRQKLQSDLKPLANKALEGVEKLGNSIVVLHQAPDKSYDATKAQIARCKGQSKIVAQRFEILHQQAVVLLKTASDNLVEATHETSLAESRVRRIGELEKITDAMKVNAQVVCDARKERVKESEASIKYAEQVKAEAEAKRRSAKTGRILRDLFTFGLGELGDWGGLNEQMDYAKKLIQSCQNDLETSMAALGAAEEGLSAVKSEIEQYVNLRGTLGSYLPLLQEVRLAADNLRHKNEEMSNKSMDVAGFLSDLSAKAQAAQLGLTAQEFARRVLDIQQVIEGRQLKGIMWREPSQLEGTLQSIASSSVPALENMDDDLM